MKTWFIRFSLYTIVIASLSISSVIFFYALHRIKQCTVLIDPYCSQEMAHHLKRSLQQHQNKFFNKAIIEKLCHQFPFIEKSSIRLTPAGSLQCSIQCASPRLLLNEEHILLSNNVIAQSTIFEPSIIQSLPRIFLSGHHIPSQLSEVTKNILNDIPDFLFTHYTLHFIDASEIYLIDKQNPRIIIVADKNSIKNINLDQCSIIQDQEKKLLEKKSHLKLVMDVRFSHQIIVRLQAVQGGVL